MLFNNRPECITVINECLECCLKGLRLDFTVDLDPEFYGLIDDLEARFPCGPPSLVRCTSLAVDGDVVFGRDIVLEGRVSIVNESGRQAILPDGKRLTGDIVIS